MKEERNEDGYVYKTSPSRPRLSGLVRCNAQGNRTELDTPEEKAEVAEWETQHPDYVEPTEESIQIWARRGTDHYTQSGEGRTECIKGLLDKMTWVELREGCKYLVDDGMRDYIAHL